MKLTGKNIIRRINTITHDGKVLIFGTSAKGKLYYSIKRSGFEDPALKEGADPFGFETWQELRLGESVLDSSVVAWEKANLAEHDGTVLVRSVYGDGADATTSVDAPVQLVSAQGHLYVFRQAPSGKILVNRFVLDGMTNQLVPKLEVRFRRSRERLTPHKPAKSDKSGKKFGGFDSLDYRDIDGKSFFEPALELGFAGTVKKGWFSVVLAPTSDDDRGRWHLFVCDAGSNKLVLYTVGSGSDGLFDVKDYLYGQSDPANREQTQYRSIPGIIRRDFDLTGLVIAGAPSATRYDLQSEQITDAGPQLIRDAMQVMLAVPVTADSDDAAKIKTAALNFALAADGSLSQIDTTPDSSKILRSETRDVITPLTLLDDIKEFAAQEKPQSGTIVATERGADDQLQVVCKEAFENDALSAGNQVEIRGTRSYDGLYKVRSVDGKTFSVDAAFQDNEMGSYEVVPEKRTGLVFDNMIVGCERTDDGKLKIHCAAHDLREYDEVQISGTRAYDGIFPVASTDPDNKSFVLEVPYFTGEAANLAKVVRRGLHMDGNDRVVTPDLDLAPPSHARSMGRTLSAWVRVDGAGNMDQNLIANGGGLMRLILRKDQKVSLWVQMSDDYHTVCDFNALDADTWTHYAATVKYDAGTGKTTIALVRDGVEVSSPTVVYGSPGHLGDQMIQFHGRDDRVEIEAAPDLTNKSFSVELWAKRDGIGIKQQVLVYQGKGSTDKNLQLGFRPIEQSSAFFFGFYNDDADTDPSQTAPDTDWHHYACTYDATTKTQRIYRDGSLAKHRKAAGHYKVDNPPAALILGHGDPGKTDHWSFHGNLSDVRLWNKALSQDAIIQNMSRRLSGHETGLLGYWPLDDGSAKDLSQNNNDGVLKGSAAWIKAPCPQAIGNPDSPIAPPVRGMHFDGVRDYITVPGFSIPNKFTISLWATSDTMDWRSGSTVWSAYSVEPLGDFSRRYNFFLGADDNNTSQRISFLGRSAMAFDEHPPTLETGGSPADITNWHHYATTVQFDSNQNKTTFRFFIDGEKVEEKSRDDLSLPDKLDSMVIGASASDGGLAGPIIRDYFAGFIADVQVWDSARSEAEIKAGMFQKLSGDEDGLVGYWPLDGNAKDKSPGNHNGTIHGSPVTAIEPSVFTVGDGFAGEISDVQVWDRARSAADIKASMHLLLSGKERGLAAYYRMGAIARDETPPEVPDFSVHGRNAVVHGNPYAGVGNLPRKTETDKHDVVRYASDEFVAVSQLGVYEESFEFHVYTSAREFNPNDVDRKPMFTFMYYGKTSQGREETIPFPSYGVQQSDFTVVGDASAQPVWYKASCRVVVPGGVRLMRAFALDNVRGDWYSIDIRRHRIRLVSDTVTRDSYTDAAALTPLPAQSQSVLDALAAIGQAESKVARLELQVADLVKRIGIVDDKERYKSLKILLVSQKQSLINQRKSVQVTLDTIRNSFFSYFCKLRVELNGSVAQVSDHRLTVQPEAADESQLFRFHNLNDGWFRIYSKADDNKVVTSSGQNAIHLSALITADDKAQRWRYGDLGDHYGYIKDGHGKVFDVWGGYSNPGQKIITYGIHGGANQRWTKVKESLTPGAHAEIQDKESTLRDLDKKIAETQYEIDWLTTALAATENRDNLTEALKEAQDELDGALGTLNKKNTEFLSTLTDAEATPATMPSIATDARALVTTGALLDFAQPVGAVRLTESCEGNVLLNYVDRQGRLRAAPYDAAADSRNASFEQWLPDAVRACADLRDIGDKITLEKAINLPASGWTCEAWVQHPIGLAPSAAPKITINQGKLGLSCDGWRFDSDIDVNNTISSGPHKLSMDVNRSEVAFFADGNKLGSVESEKFEQPALQFDGTNIFSLSSKEISYVGHEITLSIWARLPRDTNGEIFTVSLDGKIRRHLSLKLSDNRIVAKILSTSVDAALPSDIDAWHVYTVRLEVNPQGLTISLSIDGDQKESDYTKYSSLRFLMRPSFSLEGKLKADIAEVSLWSSGHLPDPKHPFSRPDKNAADLLAYWPMRVVDNGRTLTVKDVSPRANDLTVHGIPGAILIRPPSGSWLCPHDVTFPTPADQPLTLDCVRTEPFSTAVITAGSGQSGAAMMVRKGRRLGLSLDGWFFDSGVNLEHTLAAGWHHLAMVVNLGTTRFYANGKQLGSVESERPALRFNGTKDYVEVKNLSFDKSTQKNITVSVWARSKTQKWNNHGFLASKRDAFIIHPVKDHREIQFHVWVDQHEKQAIYTPDDTFDIRCWHLYTGTYDGSTIVLYVDGVEVAHQDAPGSIDYPSLPPLTIGYDQMGSDKRYFHGDIAEVALWNEARSPLDIAEDYYRPLTGDEDGLIGYWRMTATEDGETRTIEDLCSDPHNATIHGSPQDATITTLAPKNINCLGNAPEGGGPVGRLAEVRLWNLALSEAEVAAQAVTTPTGNEPGLIGYWPLDEAKDPTARDRSADGPTNNGTLSGVNRAACTANLGNPGSKVLALPDFGKARVECPSVDLANKSFTIECWARRSGPIDDPWQIIVSMGAAINDQGLHIGFRGKKFTMDFWSDNVDTMEDCADSDWHHWCCTYDQPKHTMAIYQDGKRLKVTPRSSENDFSGSGDLYIGIRFDVLEITRFAGEVAEVRVWDTVRSAEQIQENMYRRLSGKEPNLLACYPLNDLNSDYNTFERVSREYVGELKGSANLLMSTALPMAGGEELVSTEYSTVDVSGEGRTEALMRRFLGYASGDEVTLIPEQRVEELTLQWGGNTQIAPTLLGYIEGAPPVPSENLTVKEDYDGAATVTLTQSEKVSYSWQRSNSDSFGIDVDAFVGTAWDVKSFKLAVIDTFAKGEAGLVGKFNFKESITENNSTSASSILSTKDSLALTGRLEDGVSCPAVGKRWIPKNAGYALVVSGMADVFVTKLRRSGRMVSYDVRPIDGVPLDINTITFMINPAYTLNGSLDGLVGSTPGDPTFYPHVPDLRAQYGSLYPASYYRLQQAYVFKETIDRLDKDRESYFSNYYSVRHFPRDQDDATTTLRVPGDEPAVSTDVDDTTDNDQQEQAAQGEAAKRQEEIDKKQSRLEGRVRAGAAYSGWRERMERIQINSGKRNIVNTYVWDGDGGLRAEEQSFASTFEHSFRFEDSYGGGGGFSTTSQIGKFKGSVKLVVSGSQTEATGKTLGLSKNLGLAVNLSGVEKNGITDLRDYPLVPGEKVDRYRFMSFYLEGSTDHFNDFFSYVVDPEWLMSNDEEARALRQAQAGAPNKCWRVLHRVTYVERPVLMGFGRDLRPVSSAMERLTSQVTALDTQQQSNGRKLLDIKDQLDRILNKLDKDKD